MRKAHIIFIASMIFYFFSDECPVFAADVIRYAVFPAPPYMIGAEDEGSPMSGIDVDIVKEIAKRGGYELHFIKAPWKRALELMRSGDADILSSAYLTPERKVFMQYFDRPYLRSLPIAFYYKNDSGVRIDKFTDLYKYSEIGVLRGASYFKRFDTDPEIQKVEVTTQEQLYPMVLHDRIKLMAGYIPTENYFIFKYGYQNVIRRSNYIYNEPSFVYMAISKKSPLIKNYYRLNSINTLLHNEGLIKKIVNEYYERYNPYKSSGK